MFYLIQKNVFKIEHYDAIFKALDRLGLEYEVIDCLPFTDKLEFTTDRKDVFCFGTVKMANLATKHDFKPGSFYGGHHDFTIYKELYGDSLLNYDCVIQEVAEPINFWYDGIYSDNFHEKPLFIRPCVDSKIFNGGVYTKYKWESIVDRMGGKYDEHLIQINSPKHIYKEARIRIVDGKVVTSSYYKFHGDQPYEENVDPEGLGFAQVMASVWQPAPAFVMDICLTPDGWKIVELNCINCSGFYKGDMQKVLIALEDLYNAKQ